MGRACTMPSLEKRTRALSDPGKATYPWRGGSLSWRVGSFTNNLFNCIIIFYISPKQWCFDRKASSLTLIEALPHTEGFIGYYKPRGGLKLTHTFT